MFSKILRALRQRNKITQADLANVLGITQQAVARWESNKSTPDIDTLKQLSTYFNVSTDYLLGQGISNIKPLSKEQITLLKDFDSLSSDGRNILLGVLKSLANTSPASASMA